PPPKRRRLSFAQIPRKIRWIIYVNAAGGLSFGYLMIFITGYYPEIGIGPGTIGLLLGAEGAAMVTFAIPLGLYSDRYGRKLPLLAATTVLPFAALVFAVTRETLPPREARPKGSDWRSLLKSSRHKELVGLVAPFISPPKPTLSRLKFITPDTPSATSPAPSGITR